MSRKILVMSIYEHLIQSLNFNESFVLLPHTRSHTQYHIPLFDQGGDALEHMAYMAEWFFENTKEKNTIDIPYLKDIITSRNAHVDHIIDSINHHSTTFSMMKMDPIDQAIFLVGGIEYITHHTPKEILLNEMIEIAKRYGDEGSAKLINGIGHKVLSDLS